MKAFKRIASAGVAALAMLGAAGSAGAVVVNWADLTSSSYNNITDITTVNGTINVNGTMVGVTFTGNGVGFVQTSPAFNYWTGNAYTSGEVENAPGSSDLIALNFGGLKTITFSQSVSNVYMALISWNGNSGTFNQPFSVVSQGSGQFGSGTFDNLTSTSFTGGGEPHGVLRFSGNFDSVSFTDQSEYWHGIQIGIAGLSAAPEPAAWALMIGGFGMAGAMVRRRRRLEA